MLEEIAPLGAPQRVRTPELARGRPPAPGGLDRVRAVAALVDAVAGEAFRAGYRRRPHGHPVVGWAPRLRAYFWPDPDHGYAETARRLASLELEALAVVRAARPWDEGTRHQAVAFAHHVFHWGGVPQRGVTAERVDAVVQAALRGAGDSAAPMNSGWTKVAAVATAHLEAEGRSQAIWDSRVAWSLVRRLDAVLADAGHDGVPAWLGRIGLVPGRGGTRWSSPLRLRWPHAYGRWDSHFAASALVRGLRDELNRRGVPAPRPDGGEGPWTVRQVEMVLFMDGY